MFFKIWFQLFRISVQKEWLLNHVVILFLVFEEHSYCFYSIIFHIQQQCLNVLHFANIHHFLNNRHSDRCEMQFHYSFNFIFMMISDVEVSFHIPGGHLYVFNGNMSIQVLNPLSKSGYWRFVLLSCRSYLCIQRLNLYQIYGRVNMFPIP